MSCRAGRCAGPLRLTLLGVPTCSSDISSKKSDDCTSSRHAGAPEQPMASPRQMQRVQARGSVKEAAALLRSLEGKSPADAGAMCYGSSVAGSEIFDHA
mmetsp:Transcript_47122/g.83483  ORF Transcript_47122/g.83483 Transcript_47122/m.83483 type:complete len:99 (+) Transcript_47122:610-906(+)